MSDLTRVLVEAESRDAVEQGVERVVETEPYAVAWIGESDGTTVGPRTWAGDADVEPTAVDLAGDHPAARELETGGIEVGEFAGDGSDRSGFENGEFDSIVAITLTYGEMGYGVLTISPPGPTRSTGGK